MSERPTPQNHQHSTIAGKFGPVRPPVHKPFTRHRTGGEPLSVGRWTRDDLVCHAASAAAGLAVQTYWSASGRIWSLTIIAAQTGDPCERGAVLDLLAVEQARKETARRTLQEVWGITLEG